MRLKALGGTALALLLAACAPAPPSQAPPLPESSARFDLTPVEFAALPGWQADSIAAALPTFLRSCAAMDRASGRPADEPIARRAAFGSYGDWRPVCAAARKLPDASEATARNFFTAYFTPFAIHDRGKDSALVTGYYEPVLAGARHRGGAYQVALLKRPPDLSRYPTRAAIEAGALDRYRLQLVWVDPIEAFFLEIQGSGRIRFADGDELRLGYAATNGAAYVSIGRVLVVCGAMTPEQASLASLKDWLRSHPGQAKIVMDANPSYVFFRAQPGDGPIGTQGAVLSPGRSLAVDPDFIMLGAPVFLDLAQPGQAPIQRLTVAQDTGGAIKGGLRGDMFWGGGEGAAAMAGGMRAFGRAYVLLPKNLNGQAGDRDDRLNARLESPLKSRINEVTCPL
jgi:membrane-bound lytic murein transglycosylase A